jgi:hypothetical protein
LPCGVKRRIPLCAPLLDALFAQLVDFSPCLAQLAGVFGGTLLGSGNCLMRVFDGAFGTGAALFQRSCQRSLYQKLVCQNQHDKQQNRGHGPKQKCPDLLNDFVHADPVSSRRLVQSCLGENSHFYQARPLKSTQLRRFWKAPVTAVTIGGKRA